MFKCLLILFIFSSTLLKAQTPIKLKLNEEITTPSGLKIKLTASGKGKTINKGDKIKIHYVGTLVDGRVFDNSKERNQPFEFVLGMKQVIAGWDEALLSLKVGDKAILTIPPDLGYGDIQMAKIPAGSYLIFDVEVLDVFKDFAPKQFTVKSKDVVKTVSGLEYSIINQGKGIRASKGKTVEVHYTGFLENGDIFDSSVLRGQPISFRLGAGMVISGWDEGLAFLNEGGKALLIVPYELAYGENGRPPLIPPKAKLIFNVELVSVK
jgi:peptidylprolyl isomerase